MAKIFAYGTLRCSDIFEKLTGSPPRATDPGRVKNHRCLCLRSQVYPGLIKGHGGVVDGVVYTFSSSLWPLIDAFEGEQYLRKPVTVWYDNGKRELVHTYIFRPEFRRLLSRAPWEYQGFLRDGKETFMASYSGWQAARRDAPESRPGPL